MPTKTERTFLTDETPTSENSSDLVVESVEKLNLDESDRTEIKSKTADENNNNGEKNQISEGESGEDEEGDDSDEDGWIKPSNLAEIKKKSIVEAEQRDVTDLKIKVACMTSDFAMQVKKSFIFGRKILNYFFKF